MLLHSAKDKYSSPNEPVELSGTEEYTPDPNIKIEEHSADQREPIS